MHTRADKIHRSSLILVILFVLLLVFVLSACGTNTTTTGATPSPTATATAPTATATRSQAIGDGCPNTTVVATPPPTANIVLTNANSGTTISAKKGDTIEVNLPFGHSWQGPTDFSPNLLTVQGPAGYAFPTAKACVWRFLAASTGTAHLTFAGRPICKQGQACPMYIMAIPFTVDIQ